MEEIRIACEGDPDFLPVYQSEGASGADLKARLEAEVVLRPGKRALIPTGVRLQIPKGLEAQIRPRSGLAAAHGVTVLNSPGTIDSDYRGEVKIVLVNLGDADYVVRPRDRVAQIVFSSVARVDFLKARAVAQTPRGDDGFGSTGR
jgi:dUTP pyrophosphatase